MSSVIETYDCESSGRYPVFYDLPKMQNAREDSVYWKKVSVLGFKEWEQDLQKYKKIDEILQEIKTNFSFNNFEVETFLRSNLEIMDLLLEAPNIIKEFCKENHSLLLDFYIDPEEGTEEFFLIIHNNLPIEESLEVEMKLFDTWLSCKSASVRKKITITAETTSDV